MLLLSKVVGVVQRNWELTLVGISSAGSLLFAMMALGLLTGDNSSPVCDALICSRFDTSSPELACPSTASMYICNTKTDTVCVRKR